MAAGIDSVAQQNCGFRYYLSAEHTTYSHLQCRTSDFYDLSDPNALLSVSGIADPDYRTDHLGYFSPSAYAILQYVRVFLDYTPTTEDEYLNIATMEPSSELILGFKS